MFRSKGGAQSQNGHACATPRKNARGRVLDNNAMVIRNSETISSFQIPLWIGFSAANIVSTNQL